MALEIAADQPVEVIQIEQKIVEKVCKKITKETARFEVNMATRGVNFTRVRRRLDEAGMEIDAQAGTHSFDFAEVLGKERYGLTGLQVYAWLRAEFDERDPL